MLSISVFPKLMNETGIADYLHNVVSINVTHIFQCLCVWSYSFYCYTIFSSLLLSVSFFGTCTDFFFLFKRKKTHNNKQTKHNPETKKLTHSFQPPNIVVLLILWWIATVLWSLCLVVMCILWYKLGFNYSYRLS